MLAVCFFMDKNLPIMDKAEEMPLLQYAMTVTETYYIYFICRSVRPAGYRISMVCLFNLEKGKGQNDLSEF